VDTQKKTLGATERDEEKRGAWRRRYGGLDPRRFVFVDESSTNVRMVPLRARAPRGQRAFGKAPKNWEKNVTLISSISLEGMGPSMSIEGSADGEAFALYIEHFLCPQLREGQVVLMDNLQVHKSKRVRELIEGRGCSVVFLPSYSPDFNPIEEAFSKVKAILRKAKARSFEALVEATGGALTMVSEQDALGFFAHCGYATPRAQSL
jgi:transposase